MGHETQNVYEVKYKTGKFGFREGRSDKEFIRTKHDNNTGYILDGGKKNKKVLASTSVEAKEYISLYIDCAKITTCKVLLRGVKQIEWPI